MLREASPPPTCLMSCVACHMSCVTCHVSHVTFLVSQVTRHMSFFFGQIGEPCRWRVCYRRGLPHLVWRRKKIFCVLSLASISAFYPIFQPLFHLKYTIIHIQAFFHSCRVIKYLSFATLVTLVTVLGAQEFRRNFLFVCLQTSPA